MKLLGLQDILDCGNQSVELLSELYRDSVVDSYLKLGWTVGYGRLDDRGERICLVPPTDLTRTTFSVCWIDEYGNTELEDFVAGINNGMNPCGEIPLINNNEVNISWGPCFHDGWERSEEELEKIREVFKDYKYKIFDYVFK